MIKRRSTADGNRYDVRLRGPDGREWSRTFRTRKDAERYERDQRTALDRGTWIDPRHATLTFETYSERWRGERPNLRPKTADLYKSLLDRHVVPTFGRLPLGRITPGAVRSWHAKLSGEHPVTAAKAYRLLRQIMATAVADELIGRNPCTVRGAGQEHSPERPMLTVAEVNALAAAMPDHLRITVELAAWCQLRRGEVLGLERRDVDVMHRTIRVERTAVTLKGGLQLGPPKTEAGTRTLAIPPHVMEALEEHLRLYVGAEPIAPLVCGHQGGRLWPAALQKAWETARSAIGRPEVHFHDLRHAGLTWAATQGATTRELMARAGHASPTTALRYQHATSDRDAVIAHALSGLAEGAKVSQISDAARDIRGMPAESASEAVG